MATASRIALLAAVVASQLVAAPLPAQTVSQRCAAAVRSEHPEAAPAWVTRALSQGDHTVLSWTSRSGYFGTCTLNAAGTVTDVAITGQRTTSEDVRQTVAPLPDFEPYRVTCLSEEGDRVECEVRSSAEVELVETLDDSDCMMGISWGHEDDVVWVDRGCRAVFEVRPIRQPMVVPSSGDSGSLMESAGPGELRTLKVRAQDACMRAAKSQNIAVTQVFGTRAEGSYIIVLMAVERRVQSGVLMTAESRDQKGNVTCRYDPRNDQVAIAR